MQSVLIEIHPKGRTHKHFQKVLNEWQVMFDLKQLECEYNKKNLTKNGNQEDNISADDGDYERRLKRKKDHIDVEPSVDSYISDDDFHKSSASNEMKNTTEASVLEIILEWARHRASNPLFDDGYNGVVIQSTNNSTSTTITSNSTQVDSSNAHCLKDSNSTFVLADTSYNCCHLAQPILQWGCKQERLLLHCPHTCRIYFDNDYMAQYNTTTNEASAFSKTTAPPSTAPTTTPRPRWNPFFPRIVNSVHFYGYGGSLTEPPCSEWVAWRVLDTPMQISYDQWDQMRRILFDQVDDRCRRNSVQWRGSVARPIQSLNERPLWKCAERDYVSDVEKRANDNGN